MYQKNVLLKIIRPFCARFRSRMHFAQKSIVKKFITIETLNVMTRAIATSVHPEALGGVVVVSIVVDVVVVNIVVVEDVVVVVDSFLKNSSHSEGEINYFWSKIIFTHKYFSAKKIIFENVMKISKY